MDNFYEEVYQYLIDEGIEEEEATEVVNHLYEANVHEYGLITENKGKAVLSMLKAVGMMSGILKTPAAKTAVKATTKKITSGTARQGKLLTTKGTAQNFTKGRTPFTGTDPVPAASSALPKTKVPAAQTPGQLKLKLYPAPKVKSVNSLLPDKLQPKAPKPEFGPGAVKPPTRTAKPSLRPDGVAPKPEFETPSIFKSTVKSTIKTNKQANAISALKRTQPMAAPKVPKVDVLSAPKSKLSSTNKALAALGGSSLALGGTAAIVDKVKKDSARQTAQRKSKLTQQKAETRAAEAPKLEPTGERSAKANADKQEISKKEAQVKRSKEMSSAAKDFDANFAAARKAGKSEFSWRGKKYNTKYKGE